MRTREEVERDRTLEADRNSYLIVELLLDIRDLLAEPPVEICGELTPKEDTD